MTSTCVTLAFVKVNVSARDSLPPGARINPTDPLMSAGCTNRSPRESAMNCFTPAWGPQPAAPHPCHTKEDPDRGSGC